MDLAAQTQPQALELVGTVERRMFHNPENGYCVLSIMPRGATSDLDEKVTAVGYIPNIREDDEYRIRGLWKTHPKYGKQFVIQEHELLLPSSQQGVIRYLADRAYGVGPATAGKVVAALGADCLDRIKADPDCLRNLDFLKPMQAQQIIDDLTSNTVLAELTALICREGITPKMAAKIFQKYGAESVRQLKDNPYILADEMTGVGFLTADKIAQGIGIPPSSPFRVKAAVQYLLQEASGSGHCYMTPRLILEEAQKLLGKVDVELVSNAVQELIDGGRAVREGNAVYAADLHAAEVIVAAKVASFLDKLGRGRSFAESMIDDVESKFDVTYAPEQRQAILQALDAPISIITGGPGTGKSTVTQAICSIYEWIATNVPGPCPGATIHLASPTGRAAQRLHEATGRPAQTIHRLLGYRPEAYDFAYGPERPLPEGLLIVDEASMLDIQLASYLFAALNPDRHQVVLIGDVDQLPSVGPGSVLRDLIDSGKVPTTRLQYNYRQAGGSRIALYANHLTAGEVPPRHSEGDYEYIQVEDDIHALRETAHIISAAHKAGMGVMDYQVLAPMHKGKCGVANLNKVIRDIVNPARPGLPSIGQFRLGDKVLVTRNQYTLGVFNGNLGVITDIDKGALTAEIEGEEITFSGEDMEILTLAYAATVHKSQGSEIPLVVMPLLRHHYVMLQRNLLYTGMTRAKDRLVIISDGFGVRKAAQNDSVEDRNSLLAERIRRRLEGDTTEQAIESTSRHTEAGGGAA